MTRPLCYLFEAKGIQKYIFASGRLRDVVAASDLVAGLASSDGVDELENVLRAVGIAEHGTFSRRAGGSFAIHLDDPAAAARLRALWRLTIGLRCPGLEYVDALAEGETPLKALEGAYRQLGSLRDNGAASLLPPAHGLMQINPRSGRAVKAWQRHARGEAEALDTITFSQRLYGEGGSMIDRVASRFAPTLAGKQLRFPRQLDDDTSDTDRNPAFPFGPDGPDRRIALVHADLSGLGQIFRDATDPNGQGDAQHIFQIARTIETIVVEAAQTATRDVLLPLATPLEGRTDALLVPARPVLLGGDDVTILVRADAAVPWAAHFLRGIEALSATRLTALRESNPKVFSGLPDALSACAGVAIMRNGTPFLLMNRLAEDLCKSAKQRAKADGRSAPYPSLLAFHVHQSTLDESYETILEREFTPLPATVDLPAVRLVGGPYGIGRLADAGRQLEGLFELAGAIAAAPRGRSKWIEASRLLFTAPEKAGLPVRRWGEVLRSEDGDAYRRVLAAIEAMGGDVRACEALDVAMPGAATRDLLTATFGPVIDALELIDLGAVEVEAPVGAERGAAA